MIISVPHYCPNCHCRNCEEMRLADSLKYDSRAPIPLPRKRKPAGA